MELTHDVEAGTSFSWLQILMGHDQGLGISPVELFQQRPQGDTLRFGSCVCWQAVGGQPANVTDTDRVAVMVLAMRANHFLRPSGFDGPVCRNDVVVAATDPAKRAVVAVNVRHPKGTARLVGGAVNDD